MAKGITLTIFMMDGTADGKIKASNSNWNCVAYKIPRDKLAECKDLDPFKQSGVYFLLGPNKFYVGQAEIRKKGKAIHQRIMEHTTDKYASEWDEVVMFTDKSKSLGRTDISYLENRFYNEAIGAERFNVLNGYEPTKGTVTEEKMSDLEQFVEWAEILMGALGYKVFEPLTDYKNNKPELKSKKAVIPPLPDANLKIGEFIKTAMINLSESGYSFTKKQLAELTNTEESNSIFKLGKSKVAVLKLYDPEEENPHCIDGYLRYYAPPKGKKKGLVLRFDGKEYLLTKEWVDRGKQRDCFIEWYNNLDK